jgi:molybdate transport system substrate-binding protein
MFQLPARTLLPRSGLWIGLIGLIGLAGAAPVQAQTPPAQAAAPSTPTPAAPQVVQVAVAANFAAPARQLAAQFTQATGHSAQIVSGATGQLYAQITQGAPFDVLMAADTATPERLEREGWAVPGTRRTYARGELVLWSAQHIAGESLEQVLRSPATHKVAIAAPKLAPYGAAAQQAMVQLSLWEAVQPKLVTGESVGQTFQFIATGNARVGFVARSQVIEAERAKARGEPGLAQGTTWPMPASVANTVGSIDQALVQLKRSADNPAARAWLQFLQTPATRAHIAASGYRVD